MPIPVHEDIEILSGVAEPTCEFAAAPPSGEADFRAAYYAAFLAYVGEERWRRKSPTTTWTRKMGSLSGTCATIPFATDFGSFAAGPWEWPSISGGGFPNANIGFAEESESLRDFRQSIQEMLHTNWSERKSRQRAIIQRIELAQSPSRYVLLFLRQCSAEGGTDGLDIGIDLISHLGRYLLETAEELLSIDKRRWTRPKYAIHHANDDIWYMLLRALARSNLPLSDKLAAISQCALQANRSTREAATHALRDLGGEDARRLLNELAANDADGLVRESAREALADMES